MRRDEHWSVPLFTEPIAKSLYSVIIPQSFSTFFQDKIKIKQKLMTGIVTVAV